MNKKTESRKYEKHGFRTILIQLACVLLTFNMLLPAASAAELQFDLKSISESRALYRDSAGNWLAPPAGNDMSFPQFLSTVLSAGLFYDREAGKDRQILRLLFATDALLSAEGWDYYGSQVRLHHAQDDNGNKLAFRKGTLKRDKDDSNQGHLNIALDIPGRASTKLQLTGEAEITEISTPEFTQLPVPPATAILQTSGLQRHGIRVHYRPHRNGSFKFPEYPVVTFHISGKVAAFRTLKLTDAGGKNIHKGEIKQSSSGENELLLKAELWKPLPGGSRVEFALGEPEFRTLRGSFSVTDVPLP